MITVIASIKVRTGKRSDFLKVFKSNVPNVVKEDGCIEYYPAVDVDTGIPVQELDGNLVTIIEKWQSVEALKTHLKAPHMASYRENVKEMVEDVSIQVLQEA